MRPKKMASTIVGLLLNVGFMFLGFVGSSQANPAAATTTSSAAQNYASHLQYLTACDRSGPLGMINGDIQDWQISTSSTYPPEWDRTCHERFARLYQPNGRAWCPKYKTSSEWLQIDLGVAAKVTGVMTQGRGDGREWVTTYLVSYSMDAYNWKYITEFNGNRKVFDGNTESYSAKHVYLNEPVMARFVRFHTLSWHGHPSLRVEIIGCQVCKTVITLPPFTKMSASSEQWRGRGGSCRAEDGLLVSNKGWCAKDNNADQWLQFDVGPPTLITGVVTMGRGDTKKKQWVTRYRLAYSNDSQDWFYYNDASHLDPKEFGGNADKELERYHYLNSPFIARYVRIYPLAWSNRISLRAGLTGCPYSGKCMQEFMKINDATPCVENLAYRKSTWINSYRRSQTKRHATRGFWLRSEQARELATTNDVTDHAPDDVISSPSKCVRLSSAFVDRPTLRVDLGQRSRVSGVVIAVRPQSTNNGTTSIASQLVHGNSAMTNVERLDIYVEDRLTSVQGLSRDTFCGSVSRVNGVLFRSSMHVQCTAPTPAAAKTPGAAASSPSAASSSSHDGRGAPLPLTGRYVYVEIVGVPNRLSREFGGVICDVMVYS